MTNDPTYVMHDAKSRSVQKNSLQNTDGQEQKRRRGGVVCSLTLSFLPAELLMRNPCFATASRTVWFATPVCGV